MTRGGLARLRDHGWSCWDPIGLLSSGQHWNDPDCRTFADEYDGYLRHVAGMLRSGESDDAIIAWLVDIESNRMGLGNSETARPRAHALLTALRNDPECWQA